MSGSTPIGRIAAFVALAVAAAAAVLVLSKGDPAYELTAELDNASQLVGGEEVVVAGEAVGSVRSIELGPEGEALVTFTVNDDYAPLRRGTTAQVRTFSLSGVANRKLALSLPAEADAGPEIPDGGTLERAETVSAVDLDQVLNTLDPETVEDLKHVIEGLERSYEGIGTEANRGLRYLNPFLSASRRLAAELTADERALDRLLVDTDRLSGALASRSDDLTALVSNLDRMLGALASRKQALAASVRGLPDFMRRSNTTFVNLRAALSDLTPLVRESIPAARALRPFLPELRAFAADAGPTLRDLTQTIRRPGADNDLVELTRRQVPVREVAVGTGFPDCGPGPDQPDDLAVAADGDFDQGAFGESICSLRNGHPQLEFLRAYTGELMGWFDTFSHSGTADALGGVGRVGTTFNTFTPSVSGLPDLDLTSILDLLQSTVPAGEMLSGLSTGQTERCPNAQERPLGAVDPDDDSVPFTDGGHLTDGSLGHCDPNQVAVGP
ncbi:MAG TPA: MlaD family protein [Solirubrobacterales bacterium]|nr:MlaD family protein [Solirubrobacterales bacterium]